ncbi:MarR family winged helix-turn-helix transcriptional regulator [Deinococcus budaensis]|uniref:DNA-binding MarR family transcriptional regulator n=1 Tax=Deinococcus budaensis TaxID=1665626 RepID=A0A7W8GEM0_9DEIO|nr:MarR family transcriptional regulator [Deinococcus budaensis]MBB5233939.1 DNA-binding MarR family transcriptional regulator [Deinococcus budaensis]
MSTSRAVSPPRPFSSPEHEAYVTLQRLATRLRDETEALLKTGGLSVTQFNVLRILRGSGREGLTCGEIGGRLINKDPDVTRLLDRLEKLGLVERARSEHDRRVVLTHLSPEGRALLGRFDAPLAELHRRQFAHLPPERLGALLGLLYEAAAPPTAEEGSPG